MKWRIEKKYLRIGAIALVIILLGIGFQYTLEHEERIEQLNMVVRNTMMPIILGCILAYLLNPILYFFERTLFTPLAKLIFKGEKKEHTRKKFSRSLGILFTIILFVVLLVAGFYMVIPQIYLSLSRLVADAPSYYNEIMAWTEKLNPEDSKISRYLLIGVDRVYSQAMTYLNENILPNMDKIVAGITSGIVGGVKVVLNCILAIIISIYVMMEKETLVSVGKKLTYSAFNRKNANSILRGVRYANQVFGGFINGKLIDSFIIGAICYLFMTIVQFDYTVLISIIVGITNIIPYFGPFIGGIPSILLLLMTDFKHGLIFAVFIIVLQQIDGNIIGPIILGDRLKMSSMWILFAILIGGGFFGVPGMVLGAPCFACIYTFVSMVCTHKLAEKNLPVKTEDYYEIDQMPLEEDCITLEENDKNETTDVSAGQEEKN